MYVCMYHRVMQFSLFDNKFLISLNVIYYTAYVGERSYSANYHLRGTKLRHYRDTFDNYCGILHYVSTPTMHTSKEFILYLILKISDFN